MQACYPGSRAWGRVLAVVALLALMASSSVAGPQSPAAFDTQAGTLLGQGTAETMQARAGENYLIVVADVFDGTAPLTQFITAKSAQGFRVKKYPVIAGVTRETIRAYIAGLWETPDAPDYILLVGDTDTIPYWAGQGSKQAPTDLYYACMDEGDDWYPDIFIGRFPIQTVDQLQAMVDKTLYVEAGSFADPTYASRASFLASDDPSAQAAETHDWVVANCMDLAGFTSNKIYFPWPSGDGAQDIADAVNAGSLFTVYFGHSTALGWWGPSFGQADVNDLTNNGLYGLVFGLSCNTAKYPNPECFGETWVRAANKGSAAYLSASDYIFYPADEDWESARRLEKYFFESLILDGSCEVSPAWQAGLYRFLADYGPDAIYTRNFFEEFTLFGDPSLLLPIPGYDIDPDPVAQSLCCPPGSQVQYAINVTTRSGYNQPVTLVAGGCPVGWDVSFSVNSVATPFATVMTVTNFGGSVPGDYFIEIAGTATGGLERVATVDLNLASGAPGTATLTTPPNGSEDTSSTPLLEWQPAAQAAYYEVDIATDAAFEHIVYSEAEASTWHVTGVYLDQGTEYFWRVTAVNDCGDGTPSAAFSFTTYAPPNYCSEQFEGDFDLDGLTLVFTPDGSDNFYAVSCEAADALPTDPAGGTALFMGEDTSGTVIAGGMVPVFGSSYMVFYANANGNITFNTGDSTADESLSAHFNQPRVSAMFTDLSPQDGVVSYRNTAECCAITYEDVPAHGTPDYNTFQVELFYDGVICITWLGCPTQDCVVGLSEGLGMPADFVTVDLSDCWSYEIADMNCDGLLNAFDIDPFALALSSAYENPPFERYYAAHPDCDPMLADCNEDGLLNAFDIDPFVVRLASGG